MEVCGLSSCDAVDGVSSAVWRWCLVVVMVFGFDGVVRWRRLLGALVIEVWGRGD